jgi:hypothetical protein
MAIIHVPPPNEISRGNFKFPGLVFVVPETVSAVSVLVKVVDAVSENLGNDLKTKVLESLGNFSKRQELRDSVSRLKENKFSVPDELPAPSEILSPPSVSPDIEKSVLKIQKNWRNTMEIRDLKKYEKLMGFRRRSKFQIYLSAILRIQKFFRNRMNRRAARIRLKLFGF